MPNQVMAVGPLSTTPKSKNQSVLTAQKVETTSDQKVSSTTGTTDKTDRTNNPNKTRAKEDMSKRTAFTSTYANTDGTTTLEYSADQLNFKDNGNNWQKVDNSISPVGATGTTVNALQTLTNIGTSTTTANQFKGKAGTAQVQMLSLDKGLDIVAGNKTINLKPVAAKNVKPERKDDRTVIYRDAWPNVDLEYELRGELVKETIVVKNKSAQSTFDFTVTGGKVINHPTLPGRLTVEGMPAEFSFSTLTLDVNLQGVVTDPPLIQSATKAGISINLDRDWMRSQPAGSFPMRIDPSFGRDATSYWMFKSDGYSCGANTCYANTGTLSNNGWKHWQTFFQFPFSDMAGKTILNANLHGFFKAGIGGTTAPRAIWMSHAQCIAFGCIGNYVGATGGIGADFDINFTQGMRDSVNNSDWGTVWALNGEQGPYVSYKPYYNIAAYIDYDTPTPQAQPIEPSDKQVTVSTQPVLRVNPVGDADGGTVQYYFRVSTGSDAESGAVINSGWTTATQWTVPDGVLQDGTTYYWHVYTLGQLQTNPNWVRSFKVDLRTGKDSTQAYDTVGPVGLDLATGNVTTSTTTHSINALGGNIGLSLDYDSPAKTQKGLTGQYWNVAANYPGGVPTGNPVLTRNDQDVNFSFSTGSPGSGINSDWFFARWKGYFVAPTTGSYQFGASNDDAIGINVNGQNFGGCYGNTPCYNGASISLQAGQVVPIDIQYIEATGDAYARVYVKGAVSERTIPRDWLQTEVKATASQYGLAGRYYTDDGSHNFPTNNDDPMRFIMARNDSKLNFNWGGGGPVQGVQADNFMIKWTGYITVPTTGTYTFGAYSDDGIRIMLNNGFLGASQTVLNVWGDQAATNWGAATNLTAGQQVPITVEYFEHGGGAAINLLVRGPNLGDQEIPEKWLTPKANALPDAWRIGVDIDGKVAYERLRVSGANVILEDSTRATHEYTWTGTGFKPPAKDDGQLTRNPDNTYTLIDTDGRTYVFDAEGKLKSLTTPSDDRSPTSLKYEYSGDPSRLLKITDGVTSSRFGTLHYKSTASEEGNCSTPSGFDSVPDGMLCAFKTTDGNVTKLYYKAGQLSRIEKPGAEITDYGYDQVGRIVSIRDSVANDVIAANIRSDDSSLLTEVSYDSLGRASAVKAPAATAGASRINHTFEYLVGATQIHIAGATEPNGFSKRIEYDSLLRTTKETSVANLSTTTTWHGSKDLVLSSTDSTGLKSTTIYDNDDRQIDDYGPAPSAWFDSERKPLPAYVNSVPRISTGYDEGITGPSVSWYNYRAKADTSTAPGSGGTLTGSPRLFATGINATNTALLSADSAAPAVPYDTNFTGIGFRASGKLNLPAGKYWINANATDGVRVWIDDQIVIDSWQDSANRSITGGSFTVNTGELKRLRIDSYRKNGATGNFSVYMKQDFGFDWTNNWSSWLKPGYNLTTSKTAYDSQLGNVSTAITYSKPEYGMVSKTSIDPTGLNLETSASFEAPGTGFLRQTSKTLPGGSLTTYAHYGANDTIDNPCTVGVESINQAGKPKIRTEADPDGVGTQTGRSTETIYGMAGETLATRYNSDPWTCSTYDIRGRILTTSIPQRDSLAARTITNNYSIDGNPLRTSTTDSSGSIITERDLLGRILKYTDARGNTTSSNYDAFGKLQTKTSPVGTETYEYDAYDRLLVYKLDGSAFASITYDALGRIERINYPAGISLEPAVRDSLGRVKKATYNVGGQVLSDEITRSVQGLVLSGTENGVTKQYSYDKASRLTNAVIGGTTFAYGFGAADSSCSSAVGNNVNAGKSSNRTSLTINGATTTYCYDQADRLIASSDPRFSSVTYDSHGNTTSLGDAEHRTELTYDTSDRNVSIHETTLAGTKDAQYERDATDRLLKRTYSVDNSIQANNYYGYTSGGSGPNFVTDLAGTVVQKYISLPGAVTLTVSPQVSSAGSLTYSLANIHGDTMATVNADGLLTGTFLTGPFGEVLAGQSNPANSLKGSTYGYLGRSLKTTDADFIIKPVQMGARVYIGELGRFLQVDPVEGGTLNNYVYAMDPVNQADTSGKFVQALALAAPFAFLGPLAMALIVVAAVVVLVAVVVIAVNAIRAQTNQQTQTKADTGSQTKNKPRGYTLAPPPYPGVKTVSPQANSAAQKNAAIAASIASLQSGIKPGGFPIHGDGALKSFKNPLFIAGWTKYSVPYPAGGFEVHYSVNEITRQYADVKVKSLFSGD